MAVEPVRVTGAGAWFRPSDGGAGSLLRLADGVPEEAVRRVRDLRVTGLLPIGNVVLRDGAVWLRTPQPPGPTLADLLAGPPPLGTDDAVAVIGTVGSRFADLAEDHGTLDAALAALPRAAPPGPARRSPARARGAAGSC